MQLFSDHQANRRSGILCWRCNFSAVGRDGVPMVTPGGQPESAGGCLIGVGGSCGREFRSQYVPAAERASTESGDCEWQACRPDAWESFSVLLRPGVLALPGGCQIYVDTELGQHRSCGHSDTRPPVCKRLSWGYPSKSRYQPGDSEAQEGIPVCRSALRRGAGRWTSESDV